MTATPLPESKPKSGQTTGIALQLLGKAVAAGGVWVAGKDHREGQEGVNALLLAVDMYVKKTDLKVEVKVNPVYGMVEVRAVWNF